MGTINDDDNSVREPLTTSVVPISGATDFSVDKGSLKPYGDLRIMIVDDHTSKAAFHFRKPITPLPSSRESLNLDDFPMYPGIDVFGFAPRFDTFSGTFRETEQTGTMSVKAQRVDGLDREKLIKSLAWPEQFDVPLDCDVPFDYYKRRISLLAKDPLTLLALPQTGTFDGEHVYAEYGLSYFKYKNPEDVHVYERTADLVANIHLVIGGPYKYFAKRNPANLENIPCGSTPTADVLCAMAYPRALLPEAGIEVPIDTLYERQNIDTQELTCTQPTSCLRFVTPCAHVYCGQVIYPPLQDEETDFADVIPSSTGLTFLTENLGVDATITNAWDTALRAYFPYTDFRIGEEPAPAWDSKRITTWIGTADGETLTAPSADPFLQEYCWSRPVKQVRLNMVFEIKHLSVDWGGVPAHALTPIGRDEYVDTIGFTIYADLIYPEENPEYMLARVLNMGCNFSYSTFSYNSVDTFYPDPTSTYFEMPCGFEIDWANERLTVYSYDPAKQSVGLVPGPEGFFCSYLFDNPDVFSLTFGQVLALYDNYGPTPPWSGGPLPKRPPDGACD